MNSLLKLGSHPIQPPGANGSISGRGLPHMKLTLEERVNYAADVATGQRRFEPSLAQISALFGISVSRLRQELKAREASLSDGEADNIDPLVNLWNATSESERAEVFRRIGPAAVWDVLAKIVT